MHRIRTSVCRVILQRTNDISRCGLEQAIIGHGDYTARKGEGEDGAAARKAKAKEIEGLLKHGAHKLFTEEHDQASEQFKAEDIDTILARSTTVRTEGEEAGAREKKRGGAGNTFATATFSTQGETGEQARVSATSPAW